MNRCLLVCVLLLASRAGAGADDIKFEVLGAERIGIKAVFDTWYDEEMKRQGGDGRRGPIFDIWGGRPDTRTPSPPRGVSG